MLLDKVVEALCFLRVIKTDPRYNEQLDPAVKRIDAIETRTIEMERRFRAGDLFADRSSRHYVHPDH